MHYFDENFSKVIFFANGMGILTVDFDKINLVDDDSFQKDDPETIVYAKLFA